MADIAMSGPGAAVSALGVYRALSGHGPMSVGVQPARAVAVPRMVAEHGDARPYPGGHNKELTFRSGRDLRRNGHSPMIVGR